MLTLSEFAEVLVNGQAEDLRESDYSPAFLLVPLSDQPPLWEKTALGEVIKQGKLHLVERFIKQEPECVNVSNCYGQTPIYEAIAAKNLEIITMLYVHGASLEHAYETPNDIYTKTKTPICYAMQCSDAQTIQHLLSLKPDLSMDPNPLVAISNQYTAEKIIPLVKAGAAIDFIDAFGRTILHRAAMWGDTAAIQLLCNKVDYINKIDNAGHTALDYAKYFSETGNRNGKGAVLISYGAIEAKKVSTQSYGKAQTHSRKIHKEGPYTRSNLKNSTDSFKERRFGLSNSRENVFSSQSAALYFKPMTFPSSDTTKENDLQTWEQFSKLQI